MNQDSLFQIIDQLDKKLEDLINQVSKYDYAAFNRKPDPETWSPFQVMHHVMLSEKKSLGYVKKKLGYDPILPPAGFAALLRSRLLNFCIKAPIKFNAPSGVGTEILPPEGTLDELTQTWNRDRKALRHYMENLEEKWLDKAVFKHPYAGRISAEQMLRFFQAHFTWHAKQVLRRLI
jgi:hypothetical protein